MIRSAPPISDELNQRRQHRLVWPAAFALLAMVVVGASLKLFLSTAVGGEVQEILADWYWLDTWIVVTGALAAMACSLPGVFLVLRRQSMMGDALSHTALPGIVVAFLLAQSVLAAGWISPQTYIAARHAVMFTGAMVLGVLAAMLTEWVQKLGRVEASAALGVVFTTLFALGLLLLRLAADNVHIDADCVLYGNLETAPIEAAGIPEPALAVGSILLVNLLLVIFFYKELRISAFDPNLATTLGINARAMHYGLMAMTAVTLVAAFESVGSILVIAMLIAPAATATLLTDRLWAMIVLSLAAAASSAVLGHVMAITIPPIVFGRLGYPTVTDASTSGMMAVAGGLLFLAALLLGPRHGLLGKLLRRTGLALRIAREDLLGRLFRREEQTDRDPGVAAPDLAAGTLGVGPMISRLAAFLLRRRGLIIADAAGWRLTTSGRQTARQLVRSHRLWESYMARHFLLPEDHLHETAERVEHYIDPEMQKELADELQAPDQDPHGRRIPGETNGGS